MVYHDGCTQATSTYGRPTSEQVDVLCERRATFERPAINHSSESEFVMVAAHVLHEGESRDDDLGGAVGA
jgi:hypothetical protein